MCAKVKRDRTPDEALASLQRLCARAERCTGDALRLMRGWGVAPADARKVLSRLLADRFIDDARYAGAFVREKMNLSGWGAYKIRAALRAKGVADEVIDEALSQMEGCDMASRLDALLARRVRTVKAASPRALREKLLRYALAQGYDFQTARDCVERAVQVADDEDFLNSQDFLD